MIEQDRLEKFTQRGLEKGIDYFLEEAAFRRISEKELYDTAIRLKRDQLISSGEIDSIRRGAEEFFRLKLAETSAELLALYLKLKEDRIPGDFANQGWREIAAVVQEQAIKEGYINSFLSIEQGRDDLYLTLALKQIVQQRTEKRFLSLTQRAKRLDIGDSREAVFSVLDFESRANQILYPEAFADYFLTSCKESNRRLNILYYLCLRFGQQDGHLDISSSLEPFCFVNTNGQLQERSGLSKLFQLNTVRELAEMTRNLPGISHCVVVSDFDLYKYGTEGVPLLPKAEEYRKAVVRYLGNQVAVVGEIDYFQRLGLDKAVYDSVYRSIFLNDGVFAPTSDVELDLQHNQKKGRRIFGGWSDEANRIYTALSIARSLCEGQVLRGLPYNHACCIFDHQVKVGEQFNRGSERKVPFIALPIFSDNIGGIEFA